MGPFELMDLTGMDVNYPVSRSVFEAFQNDPRLKTTAYHKLLVDAGRLGRKSGRGHYRYDARGQVAEAPEPDFAPAAEPAARALVPEPQAALADLLAEAGVLALERDDGTAPLVVAPLGEDASACALRLGLDPAPAGGARSDRRHLAADHADDRAGRRPGGARPARGGARGAPAARSARSRIRRASCCSGCAR